MLKRPLDKRFSRAVLEGRKITTIRDKEWPVGVPIMLYNWSGAPYRSPQIDVAPVIATGFWTILIARMDDDRKRCDEWSTTPVDYTLYLDRCRETFGLPCRHRLAPLPGAEDRKEAFLAEWDRELEEHRAKYDPFYYPNVSRQQSPPA